MLPHEYLCPTVAKLQAHLEDVVVVHVQGGAGGSSRETRGLLRVAVLIRRVKDTRIRITSFQEGHEMKSKEVFVQNRQVKQSRNCL